jgi:Family of unknown function (DUF5367)
MIVRSSLFGFALWLATTLALRFYGQDVFHPGEMRITITLAVWPLVMAGLTFFVLRVLHEAKVDRAEAAIAFAMPGMALDIYALNAFDQVFPNLDAALDGVFGAVKLIGYLAILLVGLATTRLAPSDERL